MMCKPCRTKTRCIDSRYIGGDVRRRHECPKCKDRFTTYEIREAERRQLVTLRRVIEVFFDASKKAL